MLDKHEIRLIKPDREIQDTLLSEFLPPIQCQEILQFPANPPGAKEVSCMSNAPTFLQKLPRELASVLPDWQNQHNLATLGRIETVAWTDSHPISSPQLSRERAEERFQFTALSWAKKALVHMSNAQTSMGAIQRNGFCLAYLIVLMGSRKIWLSGT